MELPENVVTLKSALKIILQWDSNILTAGLGMPREGMIFDGDRHEIDQYLQAVDKIQRLMGSEMISDDKSKGMEAAIRIAMARLQCEFRNILTRQASRIITDSVTDPSSTTYSSSITCSTGRSGASGPTGYVFRDEDYIGYGALSKEEVYDLRSIAERMNSAGYLADCVVVYRSVRKSFVDARSRRLGVEKLTTGDIQSLVWEELKGKLKQWIRAAKVCVQILFAMEKRLCEQIFEGLGTATDDACFIETVKDAAIQLFNLAEAIGASRRSQELFTILDLHNALLDLLPDVNVIFQSKSSEAIRIQAARMLPRLAEAVRRILADFEKIVLHELSKVWVPRGTIHPLTRYVMEYIRLIADHNETLTELIISKPPTGLRYSDDLTIPDREFAESEGRTPLALHLIWIVIILQVNLKCKAKHYEDASLGHFFVLNNVCHIVLKIGESPRLREMIGEDYMKRLKENVQQATSSYERSTWDRILYCLRDEGLHGCCSFFWVSKSALRERFKTFNAMLEEVHRTQPTWLVPDLQIREDLCLSILEELIPAYRSFLGKFRSHIESGKHPETCIKYSVEDLQTAVKDFFSNTWYPALEEEISTEEWNVF